MGTFKDNFQIVKHLTFRRCSNLMLLLFSYQISRLIKKPFLLGNPFTASIEPTTACNLGCPECPSGLKQFTRPTGKLDLNLHESMLHQLGSNLFYINYYFQGEPFLHPQFLDLIRSAKRKKIYTSTSTNAHFIDQKKAEEIVLSGLDRLIISIDGTDQKTYENYRIHGQLDKVIEATKLLITAKKELKSQTPHLIFQFLVVAPNEHQIEDVLALGKSIGIDEVRLKSAQLYDYKHGNPLMPKSEKYARYKLQKDGTYRLKYKTGNHCWRMWSSCVLTFDGRVVPCCFDKDASHVLGKINEMDFKQIWQGKQYGNFRKAILTNRNEIDICKNCSEGSKVWL
jgi:radical SAM protein with 4Fe4S-binding SPASM domain